MRRLGSLLFLVAVAACGENSTSPGVCPNFCPGGSISIQDTVFGAIISRDSSFRGYVQSYQATLMLATDSPGVIESRPFFTTQTMITRKAPKAGDTTTVPIIVDSVRLRLVIPHRDKQATNLRLKLFQLPVTADSTSDFASLDPYFTAPPVDSVLGRFAKALQGLEVLGEVARADLSRGEIARAAGVPGHLAGFYAQANYHFLPDALRRAAPKVFGEESTFTAVLRLDWLADERTAFDDRQMLTPGLNFRPTQDTVFKVDYEVSFADWNREKARHDAFVFQVATYF